ncbi:hypothetical protein SAMN04488029_0265 [Reichenbachiella faecimaris]|uniref:Uncharacterized protein n=1 Tax=Reichenbachiella faecimaris TaxID=692418 RepID=A0A1W2G5I6_REIFA|nr:hypothetical protein [Reichenbachiella faecimaris]SMD31927.1 hypothetical protein SAMN04488029_0265 [Reichenbachiella faecimaris]
MTLWAGLFGLPFQTYAQTQLQDELAVLDAELDAIFENESDSTSLFALIDELLKPEPKQSQIQMRFGYSSRVTSAGRDFGIDQQGLTPALSFYHYSGLYADATGFWNSEFDPKYNLTVFTLGYIGQIKKKTTYSFSYDHSFYSQKEDYQTLTNSLSSSITQDFKYVYTGIDYSFSFGSETAHRLIWNLTGNLETKGFGPLKRITFLPSIAVLFGNQNITTQYTRTNHLTRFQHASDREMIFFADRLRDAGYTNTTAGFLIRMRDAVNSGEELNAIQTQAYELLFLSDSSETTFSLMNYYLTLPILFETKKRLNFYLSYNYNIPRNLDGAEYEFESNGYFGFSIAYNLALESKGSTNIK